MKSRWKSKTLWFNWIMTAAVTAGAGAMVYLPEFGLEPDVTAKIMFGLFLLTTFGNKYLRSITSQELS